MNNFTKENVLKSMIKNIPGFRSNKVIKKIIASIYYLFCILMIFISRNIGDIFLSLLLIICFILCCHVIDLILKRENRNLKQIKSNIGLPFIGMILCMVLFSIYGEQFNPQESAAKELGISLEEYNNVLNNYKNMLDENKNLEEKQQSSELDYENKQKEYDKLVKDFDKYKELVSEESIKEFEDLKNIKQNYENQISNLEKKISKLEDKLN